MNKVIQDILKKHSSKEEKRKALDLLSDEIKMARGILDGEFKHCSVCDDYYLTESFLEKNETKPARICTYQDPINSGGNDYADGYVDITYSICPKGHKHEINRRERLK